MGFSHSEPIRTNHHIFQQSDGKKHSRALGERRLHFLQSISLALISEAHASRKLMRLPLNPLSWPREDWKSAKDLEEI